MAEEGKKSIFNAGVAQTERIDDLQRAMNMARFNPLMVNPMMGIYNYEIMISAQDGLLEECWAKLTATERAKAERIKKVIHKVVNSNPIVIENSNGETKINRRNYEKFLELIDLYAKNNKILLDAHNLNSPDADEDDEL